MSLVLALLCWLAPAAARDWVVTGGPALIAGAGDGVGTGGLGHELSLARRLSGRFAAELVSASGSGPRDAAWFTLAPGLRGYLSEPFTPAGALSWRISAGLDLLGPRAMALVGVAYDLPRTRRFTARIEAGWFAARAVGDAGSLSGARVALSLVVPPPLPAPPAPVVVAEPPPPPPAPTRSGEAPALAVEPGEALVWVPHPICAFVPASEATALLQQIGDGHEAVDVEVSAPGLLPEHLHVDGPVSVRMSPAPSQGGLVVLGHPGDEVRIDDHALTVGADGVAIINAPEGRVNVEIRTGGQRQAYPAAIANGYAVWVRVRDPDPSRVLFSVGSADLSADALATIASIAENAGDWTFVLQGAYSPEGTDSGNYRLAVARAEAVADALGEAGVPRDRIAFLEPPPGNPYEDQRSQRRCTILPAAPERAP